MLCVDFVWLYVFCVIMFVSCSCVFLCLMGDGWCCLCVDFGFAAFGHFRLLAVVWCERCEK